MSSKITLKAVLVNFFSNLKRALKALPLLGLSIYLDTDEHFTATLLSFAFLSGVILKFYAYSEQKAQWFMQEVVLDLALSYHHSSNKYQRFICLIKTKRKTITPLRRLPLLP
ncbi:MAG: hypothetical protein EBU33_04470 [Sphingobacteriia bacterium]|jgi:hypothetical protein|nr:hypothetical protein [Sphingobacteriia bacterium]